MGFLRQFLIYGVAGAASRLAAVVLVPLYTRTLPMDDYGRLEVLLAVHGLMVVLGGLQVESAVARDFHDAGARGQAAALGWTALWLTLAGTTAIGVLAVLLAPWVPAGVLPQGISLRTWALLLALTGPVQWLGTQMVMLRFGGHALRFSLLSFADLTACALFSLWFIAGLGWGVDGALAGILAGKLSCCALAWAPTLGRLPATAPDRRLALSMLGYGVPSIPAVLVNWLQNTGSRLLLAATLTLADVAVAGIAIKTAALYAFVVYSFRLAWEPYAMAQLSEVNRDPRVYNRTLEWFVAGMFPVAGAAALVGPYLVSLLATPAYAAAGPIAAFFVMGQFWVGMTNVLVIGIHGARLTSRLLPVYAGGVALNVALLLLTAPWLGAMAAAAGFFAGSVLSALLAAHFSNRHFSAGFRAATVGWTLVATLMFLALVYPALQRYPLQRMPLADASAALAAGLVLLGGLTALVVGLGFEPGRPAAMLAAVRAAIRLRRAAA